MWTIKKQAFLVNLTRYQSVDVSSRWFHANKEDKYWREDFIKCSCSLAGLASSGHDRCSNTKVMLGVHLDRQDVIKSGNSSLAT